MLVLPQLAVLSDRDNGLTRSTFKHVISPRWWHHIPYKIIFHLKRYLYIKSGSLFVRFSRIHWKRHLYMSMKKAPVVTPASLSDMIHEWNVFACCPKPLISCVFAGLSLWTLVPPPLESTGFSRGVLLPCWGWTWRKIRKWCPWRPDLWYPSNAAVCNPFCKNVRCGAPMTPGFLKNI